MIVAMHITSESSDHYLELFVDKTIQEIKDFLWGNENFFGCTIYYVAENITPQETQNLDDLIEQIEENSWNWG